VARIGNQYGPDFTFLGVPPADLGDPASFAEADAVVLGAPFDGGTSHRSGTKLGPQAIRLGDYNPQDGARPHMALRVDPLVDLGVVDVGDLELHSGDVVDALDRLRAAVGTIAAADAIPVVLGGDHTIAAADIPAVAARCAPGRLAVVHFDAHADTGDKHFNGSSFGHGTPMRRVLEESVVRPERFFQIGLRGYWPEPETLSWMAAEGMRCFEMAEVVSRGLDAVLDEVIEHIAGDCDGFFLSFDVDAVDPAFAPGTGTPEPGGLSSRQALDAVRRLAMELDLKGMDVVEVAPPYDHVELTAYLANRLVLEALAGTAWRRSGSSHQHTTPLLEGR
jgi:agmatinase